MYPSFRDVGRIVVAIAMCEDAAYPYGEGADQMLDYLTRAVQEARSHQWRVDWDRLDARFKIPVRCRAIEQ